VKKTNPVGDKIWFSTTIEKDVNGEAQEIEIMYLVDHPDDGVQEAFRLEQNPKTMRHDVQGADLDLDELFKYHKESDLVDQAIDEKNKYDRDCKEAAEAQRVDAYMDEMKDRRLARGGR
jgi:hypothetical protein